VDEQAGLEPAKSTGTIEYVHRREAFSRLTEIYVWLLFSLVVAGRPLFELITGRGYLAEVFTFRYMELLAAFLVLIFPFVFKLIFGALPLESARQKRAQRQLEKPEQPFVKSESIDFRNVEIHYLSDSLSTEDLSSAQATKLFAYYAHSSRRLSQSIYSRAGVYLLVGVFVAFSGLVFFYSQTAQLSGSVPQALPLMLAIVPKFGILFFIELVAFFFLRQYRSAMDEFRYYEAVKRSREETLALIRIAADSGKPLDPIDLVKNESFFSRAGVIAKGQSTEILESRKLEKSELDILERVIEAVSRSKR
jgi:hypothetical protein